MELVTVKIEKPGAVNFILGQAHFIKTVEDLHEALVNSVGVPYLHYEYCEYRTGYTKKHPLIALIESKL